MSIADNVARLNAQIDEACRRSGRMSDEVELIAVTKTRSAAEVTEAIRAGIDDVGENRVQEAWAKKPSVSEPARWHLVGSLQTNKVKRALELFDTIQSVDSLHLAEEIQRRCVESDRRIQVMIEVNTSSEPSKHGVTPDGLTALIREVLSLDRLDPIGLMTIGPGWAVENAEASRPCFRQLRALAEAARREFSITLPHLSMGMSADFIVGIEEGATMVRIGTAIFGPRKA